MRLIPLRPVARPRFLSWLAGAALLVAFAARAQYPATPQVAKDGTAVLLQHYATVPLSSRGGSLTNPASTIDFSGQLSRINFLRSEPDGAPFSAVRFFVPDLNRNLYILTKSNLDFAAYINFQSVFPKFDNDPGFAGGLVTIQFDPAYATNGIFYTVHTEDPAIAGSAMPTNSALPGLDLTGYTTNAAVNPPAGSVFRQAVLIEWTDTNIANAMFEGSAREILRVGFNSNIHPMGDLLFNPLAQPGDADYRNLYVASGDGGAGEIAATRTIPQRLDALQGKILRITPDTNLHPADVLGENGRYRIPSTGADPNPFVSVSGARGEIFAYGFRNCHRISWDPVADVIIENDIGLHAWEEVNIIHKGTNYGYSEREGIEQLFVCSGCGTTNGKTGGQVGATFPASDFLIVTNLGTNIAPTYPVVEYSHRDGDAISSGFVYRGELMPQLYGKYIFGDITTARIFYSDLADMLANDDGNRTTLAAIHEIQIVFANPHTNLPPAQRRVFDIVKDEYHFRGGTVASLPGNAIVTAGNDPEGVAYGGGRSDIRFALGGDGELYLLSKSDGTIRQFTTVLSPPVLEWTASNDVVTVTWPAIPGRNYRLQYKTTLNDTNWNDVPGDVSATSLSASKTDVPANNTAYYRIALLP